MVKMAVVEEERMVVVVGITTIWGYVKCMWVVGCMVYAMCIYSL